MFSGRTTWSARVGTATHNTAEYLQPGQAARSETWPVGRTTGCRGSRLRELHPLAVPHRRQADGSVHVRYPDARASAFQRAAQVPARKPAALDRQPEIAADAARYGIR